MKNKEYVKKCEAGKLHDELIAAGFDIDGVSTWGDKTTVHLKDTETKNPDSIVNAHVYTEPVLLKPIDREKLIQKLIDKKIIDKREDVEVD
jgi:hypothetical protein